MELLRPCLFICLLSSSISSITSSDPTNSASQPHKRKGGDGVKRSRVRRQNRKFANAGLFLEKTFAVYALWRLLDQDFDNTNISITSTLEPDKLEFVASEGPITNTNGQNDQTTSNATGMTQSTMPQELEIMPIRHQQTNSTRTQKKFIASPTSAALLSNVKSINTFTGTTQSLLDPREASLNNIAITFKIVEDPSTATTQDQSYGLIGMIGTNDLMLQTSFPVDLSSPESQKTTKSGNPQLFEQPNKHFQTNKQEIPESNQVTEHYMPDSTTFASIPIEIPSKTAEEPSSATTHEQSTGSTGTSSTFKSVVSFPNRSGAPRLLDQSTKHFQTQNIPELRKINEQLTPGSTPFISTAMKDILEPTSVMSTPVSSSRSLVLLDTTESPLNNIAITFKVVEDPSTATTQDPSYGLIGMIGTNYLMLLTSFSVDLSSPESQKTTQSGDPQLFEQPNKHFQTNKQEIPESNQVTEHYMPDSTTFASIPIEIPSKAAEEPSSETTHEQSTGSTGTTSIFKSVVSFPTRSGAPRLLDQSTKHFQTHKQKITELRKINEQLSPGSTPFISTAKKDILEPTSVMSTPVSSSKLAPKQRFPQGTSLQTVIDPQNLEPTLFPQTIKNEKSKTTLVKPVMIHGVSKHALLARTEQSTLIPSTLKLEIQDPNSHTPSVTWHDIKPNRLVMVWQTKDPTTLLPTAESPILESTAFEPTSEAENQKSIPTTEPKRSHTQINTQINTAKSSTASLIEKFMTMKTCILTNYPSVSSKTSSISTHRTLNVEPTFDSNRLGNISVPSVAPARTYQSSSKFTALPKIGLPTKYSTVSQKTHSQTQKTTSTYSITMPNAAPSSKPSEKTFPTTSVLRQVFLPSSRVQKILSSISTKWSNFNPTETAGPRSEQANQGDAAGTMSNEPRSSNYLQSDMNKSTQTIMGHKQSMMTLKATTSRHTSKTQTVSDRRNSKTFVFPKKITTHNPANPMNKHDLETSASHIKLLFIFGCLIFLLILIFILVLWKRWQAQHWRNNMWVAGPPLLRGMYHSVSQNSRYNPHSSVEMVEVNTHKRKQKNSYVYESTSLQQEHENII